MSRYIMTTAEFVKRSRQLHGDKYGYDEAVYVNQATKVKIFCRACQKHFEQMPQKHYANGEGCWDCGVAKRAAAQTYTFDQFVEKARAKHGKRYEYDKTTYTRAKDKLTIRCRTCGNVFQQQGNAHLQGTGCPKCMVKQAHVKQSYGGEGFLERARQVHGEKFSYLGCTDPNWTQKSVVTWQCRDCKWVNDQLVLNHLAGKGCARCSKKEKHTLESFILKCQMVHGPSRYDYSEVVYMTNQVPIWVTCVACNTRWATQPDNHMNGKGCPTCSIKKFVSKGETEWLDSLGIPAENRNAWIVVNGRKFNVDALVGKTVYEFDGDYYHGNPDVHPPGKINHRCGVTMRELHERTLQRRKELIDAGYEIVFIWEKDWKARAKGRRTTSRS